MPNLNSIPEVLYEPNQPYHYHYDNLPLRNILTRIGLVNIQVDTNAEMIRGAAGSAGSLSARLGQSIDDDGSIKAASVDASLHGIGHHVDGAGPDAVEYVRMRLDERAKLYLVEDSANRLVVQVEDQSPTLGESVTIETGTLALKGSSSIFFEFEAPNIVRAHSAFPPDVAHRHHYSKTPSHWVRPGSSSSSSGPDWMNFKTTSLGTPYMEDTLRVYVNGVRLYHTGVPVPMQGGSSSSSAGQSFSSIYIESEDSEAGTFTLNRPITHQDVIRIDFDEAFADATSSSSSSSSSS